MSWNYHRILGAASLAGTIGLTGAAHAQQPVADSSTQLEEIVVTAEKREEPLQNVPVAVTVVGAAELSDEHIYSIVDLARTTPSLEMVQGFGGPGGGGQIRGIGTTTFTRSAEGAVGIVVDGVPQGNVNITNIFDMQRVEVLKGPQGTLFGLTSSAGVINMITVSPDPTQFESKVHVDYSDDGVAGSEFGEETVRAVLNAPISDHSAIRVSVTDDRTKGVQDNTFFHDDNVATDWSVRARYLFKPSDDFAMNIIADYDRTGQNYSNPLFTYVYANPTLTSELAACGITPGFSNQSRCGNNANNYNARNYGVSAQFDIALSSSVALTSITAYRKQIAAPSSFDIQGVAAEFAQIFQTGYTSSANQFSQELRIGSTGTQTVDYTVGLFYSDYLASTGYVGGGSFNVGTFDIPPFTYTPFAKTAVSTRTTIKSDAAFGQILYHVTDQLGVIAGLRYTHEQITDFSSADPYTPTTLPMYGAVNQNNVSGKLGLQYKIDAHLASYFTVTRGYKGPQVVPASQGSPQSILGAEIPTAFELGLKGSLFDRRIGFDGDVFYTRVHDFQGQTCSLNAIGTLVCLGDTISSVVSRGIELNAYGQVVSGLTLNGGYIYDVAEYPNGYTGYDPNNLIGGTTSLSRAQLVDVPKNKVSLSAQYEIPFGRVEGFVGADTVYKSTLRLGYSGDPRFLYSPHFNTGLRLGVRSATDIWSVALFVRNISNDHEPALLYGGPSFTPPGVNPAAPNGQVNGVSGWITQDSLRQVGISIDAKF